MRPLAEHSPGFDPTRPWEDQDVVTDQEGRLFRMLTVRRRSPHTAREAVFTRLLCPEWINVIALTTEGEFLAVEQYRHGCNQATLEIVGGVCDPGEAPLESARRELREETGHEATTWVSLGSCLPNPAIQDNRCHFYLALGCHSVAELHLDPSEELRVWALTWGEVESRLREGGIAHALVQCAFLHLFLWEGWDKLKATLP